MPPIPGMMHWHSLLARHAKQFQKAVSNGLQALEAQFTATSRATVEPVLVRNTPKQPLHPLARIRQSQSRWYSTTRKTFITTARNFTSSSAPAGARFDRASFSASRVGSHIAQSSGRAPFASTLSPNLTGGTLGRTAGGYTLGSGRAGGARYFSHGPASQAQVVQNVSQAVRAFFISGQKAQYDGVSSSGEKRFKSVSALREETARKMRSLPKATPGSWVDFHVNPSITALTPLGAFMGNSSSTVEGQHLNTSGLLDVLSVDFSRALKDLAAVLNDLKRLSALGDLPITHETSSIRVHFPGCDAQTVERLCEELNVQRGVVVQDEAFDAFAGTEIALLFPFAPSDASVMSDGREWFEEPSPRKTQMRNPYVISLDDMLTPEAYSTQSDTGFEEIEAAGSEWLSTLSGYQTVHTTSNSSKSHKHDVLEYQGFEGIYRFIEELDAVRR